MTRTFIEVPIFTKRWEELGLTPDDLCELQDFLLVHPDAGVIMEGTGGIRKLRFALHNNKGKSGGVRVCYTDFTEYEVIYLITAFSKDEKDNLSSREKAVLKKLITELKEEASKRR